MATRDEQSKSRINACLGSALRGEIRISANGQALFAQMQDLGYSHGLCVTALHVLSQDKLAVSDMLAYICEERPSEADFIREMARICEANGWDSIG